MELIILEGIDPSTLPPDQKFIIENTWAYYCNKGDNCNKISEDKMYDLCGIEKRSLFEKKGII